MPDKPPFIFISGGCRSGKSAYAQHVAETLASSGLFVATAEARDEEMRRRIALHQKARGNFWRLWESPPDEARQLHTRLASEARPGEVLLLDCLTLWVSGWMETALPSPEHFVIENISSDEMLWRCEAKRNDAREIGVGGLLPAVKRQFQAQNAITDTQEAWRGACRDLSDSLAALPCPVVVVSNEVGLGLVPPSAQSRRFRDMAGLANQCMANAATVAAFMVSGLPLTLKGRLPEIRG